MKFIFYQNILSILQRALLTELAKRHEVILVAERELTSVRANSGWKRPDFTGCRVIVAPDDGVLRELAGTTDALHVFIGVRAFAMVERAFEYSLAHDVLRLVFMEPLSTLGWRAPFRRLCYRWSARRYNRWISGFLCTGKLGVECYTNIGLAPDKIFEFGYFTDPPTVADELECDSSGSPSIVFVGSLDRRKNVLPLARALVELQSEFGAADFIGRGAFEGKLLEIIGKTPNIHYLGTVENSRIGEVVGAHDILVLPSLFDGWGAVVNEALQCGCRVVVSDSCGASTLIVGSDRGTVYSNRDPDGLKKALHRELNRGRTSPEMRRDIRQWCESRISGAAAAEYLLRIVDRIKNGGARPQPPWAE